MNKAVFINPKSGKLYTTYKPEVIPEDVPEDKRESYNALATVYDDKGFWKAAPTKLTKTNKPYKVVDCEQYKTKSGHIVYKTVGTEKPKAQA